MTVVWPHDTSDAMSPRTNLHVAGHLGVRLPATPPTQGALDDEELFIVEGSKIRAPRDSTLSGKSEKWRKMRRKSTHFASKLSLSSVDD